MSDRLRVGITCYPTFGGSGVIATEIGMAMAERGHKVHFICHAVPGRLNRFMDNIYFHEVELLQHPVFVSPPYTLAMASKTVEVATYENLDLLHVHYAVPHATTAFLAKSILKEKAPKIITTLHGTDITLVGAQRTYLPITRFSILESDGVTAPSQFLKHATYDKLNVPTDTKISIIPNFVDTDVFKPVDRKAPSFLLESICDKSREKVLVHVSNFRTVKSVGDVYEIFKLVNAAVPAHLILVGDGPDRSALEQRVRAEGQQDKVCFLGKQAAVHELIQNSDLFLLPSKNESFGLAALEAMSCGIPVIASNVEGIPEVVVNGQTGFTSSVGDVVSMANNALRLLKDENLYSTFSKACRALALDKYRRDKIIDKYEAYYREILGK